ncbi:hypothetical protein DB346_13690 [Verrucomicrobia bacterium LW23]|nr:hypothetical protein DB346_13690 [Verrucomicrobia bacterium LW23]
MITPFNSDSANPGESEPPPPVPQDAAPSCDPSASSAAAAAPAESPAPASAAPATDWDGFSLPDPTELPARVVDRWERLESVAREVSEELLAELPDELKGAADEVSLQIVTRPERGRGFAPNLLGVFLGLPRQDARAGHTVIPPQICLFVENLWWQSGYNMDAFRDEVRLTLYHELGHYLGMDEEDLRKRGLQ